MSVTGETARSRLLAELPDTARWVETRGALLDGVGTLFGGDGGWMMRVDGERLLSVVGEPRAPAVADALAGLEGRWSLLCDPESAAGWSVRLPDWKVERAVLHELPGRAIPEPPPVGGARIEPVSGAANELLEHLPARLRREISAVVGRRPLFAAWVGRRAVSFCYAASITETLWDVSVDTVAEYRGRGLAGACAALAIQVLDAAGKRPVWGAVESNRASLRVAAKLGFRRAGAVAVFESAQE